MCMGLHAALLSGLHRLHISSEGAACILSEGTPGAEHGSFKGAVHSQSEGAECRPVCDKLKVTVKNAAVLISYKARRRI